MKEITFSHPKLNGIKMNFGQLVQVIGDNNEIKQQLWQILSWYLSKHKYSEAELTLLDYKEPEVYMDELLLNRNTFQCIVIESMSDIHELLSIKKGTPVFQFFQQLITTVEISKYIEDINILLEKIAIDINEDERFEKLQYEENIKWCVSTTEFIAADILQKQLTLEPINNEMKYAIEYVDSLSKYKLLHAFLKNILSNSPDPILIMLKNIDDTLHYEDFSIVMKLFEDLANEFPQFYCMIFPSQIGYVYIAEKYIPQILVTGQETHALEDGLSLYESICRNYPDNKTMSYGEFLKLLQMVSPYLFTSRNQSVNLLLKEQVIIKLINELYGYYDFIPYDIDACTTLELNYLFNKSN